MENSFKIKKYCTLIFGLLIFSSTMVFGQEYTDKELGFDRENLRKELLEHDHDNDSNPNSIDIELQEIRKNLVKNYTEYLNYSKTNAWITPPNSGCTNMGFESGTEGWALYYRNNIYNQTDLLSSEDATGVFSVLGSSTTTNISEQHSTCTSLTGNRISILPANTTDPILGQVIPGADASNHVIRLGQIGYRHIGREEIAKKFTLSANNSIIRYGYAIVLNDINHAVNISPYFRVNISINGASTLGNCGNLLFDANSASQTNGGFQISPIDPLYCNGNPQPIQTQYKFRTWTTNTIDLSQYILPSNPTPEITISFSVSDCVFNGDFDEAWAYFDAECLPALTNVINIGQNEGLCIGQSTIFTAPTADILGTQSQNWVVTSSLPGSTPITYNGSSASHTFNLAGTYNITYTIVRNNGCNSTYTRTIEVVDCTPCINCTSFDLVKQEKYLVSGWVKEEDITRPTKQYKTFESGYIKVSFTDVSGIEIQSESWLPTGEIIDGWQRIVGEFEVPINVDDMKLELVNRADNENIITYFDDIRVFPTKGNMKSFVYDQQTQRLMAELDENNYSTFYEYDLEGGLVRIKKETEKGVFTIQETRSGNVKKEN